MNNYKNSLVIDVGNTKIKVALFNELQLIEKYSFFFLEEFQSFIKTIDFQNAILSSVRSEKETQEILNLSKKIRSISTCKIPMKLNYKTPLTLGTDRLANAFYAYSTVDGASLVLDMGTCIKFDCINEKKEYQGGSISPGLSMRYESLHDYTGKLPKLHYSKNELIIGRDTNESIHSGIINGIIGELTYFIDQYQQIFPNLTIFMTGGDSKYFDNSLKKSIFAVENLTLSGLNLILQANVY